MQLSLVVICFNMRRELPRTIRSLSPSMQRDIAATDYEDEAEGTLVTDAGGGGRFREVRLHPRVVIADPARQGDLAALHHDAHRLCFIAQSVNFPVHCEPRA